MTSLHGAQAALQSLVSQALAGIVVGTKETITIGGTITGGDAVTLTLASSGIAGSPVSVSYTVKPTDTLLNVGAGLARALNANAAIRAAGIIATASGATPNVFATYAPTLSVTWSANVSGEASETVGLAQAQMVPQIGIGWPPLSALQAVAQGGAPLVTVYDRKVGRNVMRWNPYAYNQVAVPATLTTALAPASGMIQPSGTATITLGGTPGVGDAVSCVVNNRTVAQIGLDQVDLGQTAAQVVSAVGGDTASTMATKLAAAINGDATLSLWLSAAAVGPAVTLTSLIATAPLTVQSYAGNGGTQEMELIRKERQFQVVAWTRTELQREQLCDPVDTALATAQATFSGVTDASGNPIRVLEVNDYDLEDDTQEDVYRHDFLVLLEYAVTTVDQLYAVLAPVVEYQVAD
jgi:hypothetical protein